MDSLTIQSTGNVCSYGASNTAKIDPTKKFCDGLVLKIFSYFNFANLGNCCSVSKAWNRLAKDPTLWKIAIHRELAFGNAQWAQCFGPDVVKDEDNWEEYSSLPLEEFIADCRKFTKLFPGRSAKDSLMLVRLPRTLHGGLTLKSLGELARKYFPKSSTGYRFIWSPVMQEQGDKSIDRSRWVVMTRDILPGTRGRSYAEQQRMIADLASESLNGYGVPGILKATACIFSQYFGSSKRLFSDDPRTYIRCVEEVKGLQIVVGDFAPAGLDVIDEAHIEDYTGVAVMREF